MSCRRRQVPPRRVKNLHARFLGDLNGVRHTRLLGDLHSTGLELHGNAADAVEAGQGAAQRLYPTGIFEDTVYGRADLLYVCFRSSLQPAATCQLTLLSGRITVMLNILNMLTTLLASIPPQYHDLLAMPSATLTSILACRVYRRTRLGVMQSHSDLTFPTVNTIGLMANPAIPFSVVQFATESSGAARSGDGSESTTDKSETLGRPSKANTLSFSSGTPHDISTASAS
jgi:hypothetical protein